MILHSEFLNGEESNALFSSLLENTSWRQDEIKIFGKNILQPRLSAIYGDDGVTYTYSGLKMPVNSWTEELLVLKNKVEEKSSAKFNLTLINLYRDGNDSMGWHSDDEKELGKNPVIASLSLGESRNFKFRPKKNNQEGSPFSIHLNNGSLLIMKDETQHYWQHSISKSKKVFKSRINLTFRLIKN